MKKADRFYTFVCDTVVLYVSRCLITYISKIKMHKHADTISLKHTYPRHGYIILLVASLGRTQHDKIYRSRSTNLQVRTKTLQ